VPGTALDAGCGDAQKEGINHLAASLPARRASAGRTTSPRPSRSSPPTRPPTSTAPYYPSTVAPSPPETVGRPSAPCPVISTGSLAEYTIHAVRGPGRYSPRSAPNTLKRRHRSYPRVCKKGNRHTFPIKMPATWRNTTILTRSCDRLLDIVTFIGLIHK
jgi:hypothetical protein